MLPNHVINFVYFKIADLEKSYANSLAKYTKLIAEYNALPFYKRWFTDNPEYGYWAWQVGDYYINQLKDIQREAEYKNKMKYEIMDIDPEYHKAFYAWAKDNKIPY